MVIYVLQGSEISRRYMQNLLRILHIKLLKSVDLTEILKNKVVEALETRG